MTRDRTVLHNRQRLDGMAVLAATCACTPKWRTGPGPGRSLAGAGGRLPTEAKLNRRPRELDYPEGQPDEATRLVKGGSFLCAPNYCMSSRPAARLAQDIGLGTTHIGFRVAYDQPSAPSLVNQGLINHLTDSYIGNNTNAKGEAGVA